MTNPLLSPEVRQYILEHRNDDPYDLALRPGKVAGLPVPVIAGQIRAWQKAAVKIPSWARNDRIIWPPLLSMEQCSSEHTARYKAGRICGSRLVDLTGGTGVDAYFLSASFDHTVYVERDPSLCDIARHNYGVLNARIEVVNEDAGNYAGSLSTPVDVFYLDPARRDPESRQRFFRIEDFRPNPVQLVPELMRKAEQILIKFSPMADLAVLSQYFPNIKTIEVLSVRNEVREVLCYLGGAGNEPLIRAVDLVAEGKAVVLEFRPSDETASHCELSDPRAYLYEPSRAVLKAGAFRLLCSRFPLSKLHRNTHLYTTDTLFGGFPGRVFAVINVLKPKREAVLSAIPSGQANIIARNFGEDPDLIRKRLGIREGGEEYLFAARLAGGRPVLIHCRRVAQPSGNQEYEEQDNQGDAAV